MEGRNPRGSSSDLLDLGGDLGRRRERAAGHVLFCLTVLRVGSGEQARCAELSQGV